MQKGKLIGFWVLVVGDCNELQQYGAEGDTAPYGADQEVIALSRLRELAKMPAHSEDTFFLVRVYADGQIDFEGTDLDPDEEQPELPETFNDDGGLLSWDDNGTLRCLGYLMDFNDDGVFDATYGKVNVTPEQAKTHNQVFDKVNLEGLDKCEIGQGSLFYFKAKTQTVTTFTGTRVDNGPVVLRGKKVTFQRNGRTFEGKTNEENDSVHFTRIA